VLAAPAMRVGVVGSILGSVTGNVLDDRIADRLSDDVAFTLPAERYGNILNVNTSNGINSNNLLNWT